MRWAALSPQSLLGRKTLGCAHNSYLVDTDQEVEGLAVIADFQGAALDDDNVLAEYKEIRDAVLADVGVVVFLLMTACRWRSILQSAVEEV